MILHFEMTRILYVPIFLMGIFLVRAQGSVKQAQLANAQQGDVIKTALNQITAEKLPSGVASKFLNGTDISQMYCDTKGVDGKWTVIDDNMRKECIKGVLNNKAKAQRILQHLSNPKTDCKYTVSKKSMVCHVRRVMTNVINDPYYQLYIFGNVVELVKDGVVIMMAVAEKFNYTITSKSKKKQQPLHAPNASLTFNVLGGFLGQKGEIPTPKRDDPCASCLEMMNKGTALDGKQDSCGGCDSFMDFTSLKPDTFRYVNKGDTKKDLVESPKPAESTTDKESES
ncbi:hypothetical protein TCON_0468 [Astathelohania contejeani]|uniref:Uncharacterized protein n=1 Tax=Astathelohania contejeani TaxID=164912 RepID=A0ABQ7I1M0_9MICR|nr:hypothetical protein TCON_0468 [Thelohania contejeani]